MYEELIPVLLFKRELLARKYSQSSIETYCSCLTVIIKNVGDDFNLEKIKDYLITINKRSYHKQLVAAVRNYYLYVLKKKISFDDLPYPRKEEKIPEILSVDEMRKIIEYPKNLKHQCIICLLYDCGLRIGEILRLELTDINRSRMELFIRASKQNKDRIVPIEPHTLKLLEEYYKAFKPKKYLFNGQQGDKYTETSINQLLKYWAKRAGINKRIHAHKIRHTYATHLHENGTDLNIIRDLLGHSDVRTTEIYTKTSQAKKKVPSLLRNMNLLI